MKNSIKYKRYYKQVFFLLVSFLLLLFELSSQTLYPLNYYFNQQLENNLSKISNHHSSFKPIILNRDDFLILDSIQRISNYSESTKPSYIRRKLFYESAIIIDTTDFYLAIDPVFNFQFARDVNNTNNLTTNTRGIQVKGTIGERLYFQTAFYENQAYFPEFISSFMNDYTIAPGQGLIKPFKTTGFDYAWSSGLLSYSPFEVLNVQFGHGKNFVGNGYRSLLLSDNSFNYPFLKLTSRYRGFQYTNLFASFFDINLNNSFSDGFQKKYATFHFLNYENEFLEIGIFQSTIWQAKDSTIRDSYQLRYLNPIILYEPVTQTLGAGDNSLIGLNFKIQAMNSYQIYGQYLIDEIEEFAFFSNSTVSFNKTGFQIGLKAYNFLNIKNLFIQVEFNNVRPYTYASSNTLQNYAHYQQPLAHPQGANFKEGIGIVNYRFKNVLVQLKSIYTVYGADTALSNYGKDVFMSDDYISAVIGNEKMPGLKTTLLYINPEISYILNPNTNMQVSLGIVKRQLKSDLIETDLLLLYFAFRTTLNNFYYDF